MRGTRKEGIGQTESNLEAVTMDTANSISPTWNQLEDSLRGYTESEKERERWIEKMPLGRRRKGRKRRREGPQGSSRNRGI